MDYFAWRQADSEPVIQELFPVAEIEPAAHINNLYNTTFWALILKGGLSTAEAHAALKVGDFVPVISPMTEASLGYQFKSEAREFIQQVQYQL
jgi:hypothetical protein